MDDNRHVWLVCVFMNIVSLICWTLLAAFFGKWWIALFSLLFWSSIKVKKHHVICDGCGKATLYADSIEQARIKAAAEGWISMKNGDKWEDYCPECQRRVDHGAQMVGQGSNGKTCSRWANIHDCPG